MIHYENVKSPSPNDTSTDSINKDLLQSVEIPFEEFMADLADRVEQAEKKAGRIYETKKARKKKTQAERRKRRENSLEYKLQCLLYVMYLIFMAREYICPSQTTLGATIGVNRDTCRKYLRILVNQGWLGKWVFRLYETCIYKLSSSDRKQIIYLFRNVKRPKGFPVPSWLFGMVMGCLPESEAKHLLKYSLTHESSLKRGDRDKKYIENRKKREKKLLKSKFGVPCPIQTRTLITKYDLNKSQAEFLARNKERVLSLAMEDVDTYNTTVRNYFGLLIHRCRCHGCNKNPPKKKELKRDKTPWLKKLFAKNKKLEFIKSDDQIDRTKHGTTFVKLMINKSNPAESILYLWKRVNGYWVDKRIAFTNNRFEELVEPFLRAY